MRFLWTGCCIWIGCLDSLRACQLYMPPGNVLWAEPMLRQAHSRHNTCTDGYALDPTCFHL
eukprot:scaffold59941_cov18-Tisochrysis_lutea.AAC.1